MIRISLVGPLLLVLAVVGCGGGPVTLPDLAPAPCTGGVDVCGCSVDAECPMDRPRCTGDTHKCVACLPERDNCGSGAHCLFSNNAYSCSSVCRYQADCNRVDAGVAAACCMGSCLDVANDVANCGACGHACAALPHSFPACAGSSCVVGKCADGFADCNHVLADGCETDLTTDGKNCGACGSGCGAFINGSQTCVARACVGTCTTGYGDCNKLPADGCETTLTNDVNNCGACGAACKAPKNAIMACTNGKCVIAGCNAGTDDCDGNAANGCEVNLVSDAKNCSVCGLSCTVDHGVAGCANSACIVASCDAGFGDCNQNGQDGCEAALSTDVRNCGACGTLCKVKNASSVCKNGLCAFSACSPGYADCNKNLADGCEQSVDADPSNCGACGNVCPKNLPICGGGVCVNIGCSMTALFTREIVPGVWACVTDHVIGTYAESNALCGQGYTPATYNLVQGLPFPSLQQHQDYSAWYRQSVPNNGGYIRTGQKRRGGCQPEAHGDIYIANGDEGWNSNSGGWHDLYYGGSSCLLQTDSANNVAHQLAGVICVAGAYELPMP